MDKLSVRRGASLPITLTLDEDDALSVQLIVKKSVEDSSPTFVVDGIITENKVDLTIPSSATEIAPDVYLYQVTIVYANGHIEKYPETQDCDDDEIDFPTLTIQPSLD